MKEENKIPLLAIAILIVFLIIATACAKQEQGSTFKIGVPKNLLNEVFILPTTETFPEERNVLTVAVPVIPVRNSFYRITFLYKIYKTQKIYCK